MADGYRQKLRTNPTKAERFVTLSEAVYNLQEEEHIGKIVILPPESGDVDIPSDEEAEAEEGEFVEPAGEVEVLFSDEDDESEDLINEEERRWSRNQKKFTQDNGMSFHFDKVELLNFLGILLISGYHSIPSDRTGPDNCGAQCKTDCAGPSLDIDKDIQ